MTSPEPHKDRLNALEARLRALKGDDKDAPTPVDDHLSQSQAGWQMVTELVAGIGIGFAMGWGLDSVLGTKPVFIVVMTLLGFAAGIRVMLGTAANMQAEHAREAAQEAQGPDTGKD